MVTAIISLGAIGLLFGVILGIAGKVFHVDVDPRIEQIAGVLPGANCGGCGFPGCSGYAEAIVGKGAEITLCPVGKEPMIHEIAGIMGVEASAGERSIAVVMCAGGKKETAFKYIYHGVKDCKSAAILAGGDKECSFGCLGLGSCEAICPFNAIKINDNGLPEVDPVKCTGCGKCVKECPKAIIKLVSESMKVHVRCSSKDKGVAVKKYCEVGCIGCKLCEKVCPFDAVHVVDNVAVIDYTKCRNCEMCVTKCPIKTISSDVKVKKVAYVRESDCVGCTICAKQCPVGAVEGAVKEKHKIIADKCIGCGVCADKCPKKCIEMRAK